MDKKQVIDELQAHLVQELNELGEAGEDDERVARIRRQMLMYKFLPARTFTHEDVICASGLVELELNGIRSFYLIVPSGGGLVTRVDGCAVQVITPQSPLGEVLVGRKVGETIQVSTAAGPRTYKIISCS